MHAAFLPSRPACLLLISMAACIATPAMAQEVALPATAPTEAPAASVTTPSRGSLMTQVEAKFGAPSERHAAIGNPPITRWDYPGFSVFFEHQHVIHAVVK